MLDWPNDVTELTSALDIDRFAVIGWSLGGPFAAACAFALQRLSAAIPGSTLTVVPGEGHFLANAHLAEILGVAR